jgi:hypothetical protein
VHIDVKKTGLVWLQHDGTDLKIAEMLVAKGVARKDIVIGFHLPFLRTPMPQIAA